MGIVHLLHIKLDVKFFDEITSSIISTTLEFQRGPLVVVQMSFMSHNNIVATKLGGEPISKS
jgi:hypothetical protein